MRPDFQFTDEMPTQKSVTDLPPGPQNAITAPVQLQRALTIDEVEAVNDGRLKLFVYGIAEYTDPTFVTPRRLRWRWCYFYNPKSVRQDGLLWICPVHNGPY